MAFESSIISARTVAPFDGESSLLYTRRPFGARGLLQVLVTLRGPPIPLLAIESGLRSEHLARLPNAGDAPARSQNGTRISGCPQRFPRT